MATSLKSKLEPQRRSGVKRHRPMRDVCNEMPDYRMLEHTALELQLFIKSGVRETLASVTLGGRATGHKRTAFSGGSRPVPLLTYDIRGQWVFICICGIEAQ